MDSRAQEIKATDPLEPDTLARIAGKDIYGTSVGTLRRVELWRLGNVWGMQFPVGATKDYMLPFFKQLEAEGKNPLQPPGVTLTDTGQLRTRDVSFSKESHVEDTDEVGLIVKPAPVGEFEAKLNELSRYQLKKVCKMRGIPQELTDKKQDLIARILAASEGGTLEQDTPEWDQRPPG